MNYPKLPPTFKKKWISALISGTYRKGVGQLKYTNEKSKSTYCCLGVAATISKCEINDVQGYIRKNIAKSGKKLPEMLIGENIVTHKLVCMNDGLADQSDAFTRKPQSFIKIAKWIKENL